MEGWTGRREGWKNGRLKAGALQGQGRGRPLPSFKERTTLPLFHPSCLPVHPSILPVLQSSAVPVFRCSSQSSTEPAEASPSNNSMVIGRFICWFFLASVLAARLSESEGYQTPRAQPSSTPGVSATPQPSPQIPAASGPSPVPSPSASPRPAATYPIPTDRASIVKLQIFLDQHSFTPGEINGHWSGLCANALQEYQSANGQTTAGPIDDQLRQQFGTITPYTKYQIRAEDLRWVGQSPLRPAAQARLKKLPYPSLIDFVAERFHTSKDFLRSLNPGRNLEKLRPGDTLQVPNVAPFQIESIKPAEDTAPRPQFSGRTIKIDTKRKILDLVEAGKVIASFPITPGSKQLPAPVGTWKIVRISSFPFFRWDRAMLLHGKRSGDYHNIPPGPRNEVGLAWIGLNKKGIGVHGTNNPDSIGRTASHGCIRLANWDVARLAGAVTRGMTVEIF
jgi:lipoprotein-anchoring transpeptidase ErfK/SrfK